PALDVARPGWVRPQGARASGDVHRELPPLRRTGRDRCGRPVRVASLYVSTQSASASAPRGFGATSRRDWWWLSPLTVVVVLSVFGLYSLYAILVNGNYRYTGGGADYLSPFYSPNVETLFGVDVPFSAALLVAWMPLGLRLTCYYYRKAYYRSFFLAPPACAVAGPTRQRYTGESRFPL